MTGAHLAEIALLLFDIDGTLTDATTTWGGPDLGWLQTYSTRDGEALKRIARAGVIVAPLSRNETRCAQARIASLGLDASFLGTPDKAGAVDRAAAHFDVDLSRVCYIADGPEDAAIFARVGCGVAVADAHPAARQAADLVLTRPGGGRAIEELESLLQQARGSERA